MGANMAAHLLKFNGRDLVVYDMNTKSITDLVAKGAVGATSPKEVAEQCSTIITMLPSGPVLDKVYTSTGGVFEGIQSNTLLIDASTIGPVSAKDISAKIDSLGKSLAFCDAPVSGGVPGAAAGTLTFMVGGSEATFNDAKPYLAKMGKNVVHCGPVCAGQTVKVCNNLLLAASMIAVSEAMLMGTKLGCDPKTLASVLNTSTGRCWSSDSYNPYPHAIPNDIPSAKGYAGGFACDLMKKDLGLACEAGKASGVELTAGTMALELYSKMSSAGMGNLDFAGALKFIEEKLSQK
eukprot:TRINITY_DN29071_c0_g1_i1.p3 TRINITY_DN29071_c0_g1~~TRINITY_DN29071_c0_g1_i1.p3  ORF type:complete len:332 (+),score=128.75 TRINITY_DN29071_c0_g1_i1:119-997(+)